MMRVMGIGCVKEIVREVVATPPGAQGARGQQGAKTHFYAHTNRIQRKNQTNPFVRAIFFFLQKSKG